MRSYSAEVRGNSVEEFLRRGEEYSVNAEELLRRCGGVTP